MALLQELQTMQEKEGQLMETIITICYLVFVLGSGLLISHGLVNLWDAHKRGMARVKAYDKRQGEK
jgi:hypothetical protein